MVECDVVVVGAGAMGSSAAWWLARSGVDVVVLEQFEPGHRRGSSHGSTRIFRLAYPEGGYIEMARQALTLWRELEEEAGAELLVTTGGIDFGNPGSLKAISSALGRAGVEHEVVAQREAGQRWAGFAFDGDVVYQRDAGRVLADRTVHCLHDRAGAHGASLHFNERVAAIRPEAGGVTVSTDAESYRARVVVVTAGAWVAQLLSELVPLPTLTVTREQVFHFPSRAANTEWPSYIHHYGNHFTYGLQGPGDEGVKVAEHHTGAVTTADGRSFDIDEAGRHRVHRYVERWMPGLEPEPTSDTTCLYTTTPDESFVIERHGPIVVGSPCSGHGFKFVPWIGRRLAELARSPG